MSRDSRQDELSADALSSLKAVLHLCCGNPHSWSGITVSAAVRQTDGWQIFCTANIGLIKSLGTKLLLLVLSSSVHLVQPSRKAMLMYALSESNMPTAVPSDCFSLHSSLILKVILGRFCSDYSSGRANNQPWARIHLWGTSAGNNTKVDAPGLTIWLKTLPLSVCFLWLFVVVHANKTDWTENKWWHCSFPVFLCQPLNEQKRAGQKNSIKSFTRCSPGLKNKGSGGGVGGAIIPPSKKRLVLRL